MFSFFYWFYKMSKTAWRGGGEYICSTSNEGWVNRLMLTKMMKIIRYTIHNKVYKFNFLFNIKTHNRYYNLLNEQKLLTNGQQNCWQNEYILNCWLNVDTFFQKFCSYVLSFRFQSNILISMFHDFFQNFHV